MKNKSEALHHTAKEMKKSYFVYVLISSFDGRIMGVYLKKKNAIANRGSSLDQIVKCLVEDTEDNE
ncbi:hypothetical protein LEP3755_01660 [Leptolyngbya sp. NIES-3755]|nr:hypothetical protein LEP3755_01660 [Leptolyngbya sp. NIES-3755]